MENQPRVRIRVGVDLTSKGIPTPSVTAEILDPDVSAEEINTAIDKALSASDDLMASMLNRYGSAQAEQESLYKQQLRDSVPIPETGAD